VASKLNIGEVRIFDTTLREGEQTPGVVFTVEEKLEIARQLDKLGVDTIEAGFPASSEEEFKAVKSVAGLGLRAEVCALARTLKFDVDQALKADVDAVHTFIGTSEWHLKYKLKITPGRGRKEGRRDHRVRKGPRRCVRVLVRRRYED